MISKLYQWIGGALLLLGGVLALFLKGKSVGKKQEQQKQAEAQAETVKEVQDVQNEVARLPDSAIDERLSKWTRD
jgi:hypothetical protein